MMLRNYASMTNLEYHEKQLNYNSTSLLASIAEQYPELQTRDLNDPRFAEFLADNPYNPKLLGDLAQSLGLDGKFLSPELWKDLSNGWCPVSETSPLFNQAQDTPRGKMVQFRKTATPINPDGSYRYPAKGEQKNRLGTEFIFCFGERLSTAMALLATEDPSIEKRFSQLCNDVFRQAVAPEMLNLARIRKGQDGTDYQCAAEILGIPFFHIDSRSESPFLHFHFDLLNVARGYDGKLYSLCTDEIGANASALDAIFMRHMKEGLEREFGFVFDPVKHDEDLANEFLQEQERKTVSFDLPESLIPAQVRDWRSTREQEIQKALKASGKSGYQAEELARLTSRDEKTDKSPAQLKAMWHQEFQRMGWTPTQFKQELSRVKATHQPQTPLTAEVIEETFLRHHKDVAMTESQYLAHIQKQLLPSMTGEQAEREATRIFERDCVLSLSKEQMDYFKPLLDDTITDPNHRQSMQLRFMREARFLHRSTIVKDTYISSSLKAREQEQGFQFDRDQVARFILDYERQQSSPDRKFKFALGQREAVQMILTEPGAVCNVAGRAGAGKSTLLKAAREFYVAHGFKVFGTSTSSTASKGLAESTGMSSREFHNTTRLIRLLDEGKLKLDRQSVLFWDEAGMADTNTFYRVIQHINNAGAKLVLVGEKEQLQSVGFGGNFSQLNQDFVTTPVREINRQVDQWQREMVEDFASGQAHQAIRTLYENGKVIITPSDEQRLTQIVNDYLAATSPAKDKIILATTNDDIERINLAVRTQLKQSGRLPEQEVVVQCKDKQERAFSAGDRIVFTKNQKSDDANTQQLNNSDTGEVSEIFLSKLTGQPKAIKLKMDDGRETVLDLGKSHALRHAYAVTVHKSQGQTKNQSFYFVSSNTNSLHHAYVACSRHRLELKLYLSEDMVSHMESKLDGKAPTASMMQVAQWIAREKNLDLPSETLHSFTETRRFLDQHWKATTGHAPHPLDRLTRIVEAMVKTNFKKTSHHYEILDGKARNTYEALKMARVEQIRRTHTLPPTIPDPVKAQLVQKNLQAQQSARLKQLAMQQAHQQTRSTMHR